MQRSYGLILGAMALFLVVAVGVAIAAFGLVSNDPQPPTPIPATEPPPPPPEDTPIPTPPTAVPPQITSGTSIVVGGPVRLRADPSTANAETGTLYEGQSVRIAATVKGENWLVGSQTWVSSVPDWTTDWYQLDDGSYVYGAFVFTLQPEETSPTRSAGGAEKWIDVNLSNQTISAMIGDQAIKIALVTSGSPDFPTPAGTHHIEPDGKVASVDMTASQAGYSPGQATYDVARVLFTMYFDRLGNAIHMNYWRPAEVYGNTATSHGCVGLQLHDAQYFWLFGEPGMRVEIHD